MTSKLDVDQSRCFVYSTNNEDIRLHKYEQSYSDEIAPSVMSFMDRIPIVKTWEGERIKPDNLLLHGDGTHILMTDQNNPENILRLNIEQGVVTNKKQVHTSFYGGRKSEDVGFKVSRFDYNNQSQASQNERCVVAINDNHLMRFDMRSGTMVNVQDLL